jgi:hypothetical protein
MSKFTKIYHGGAHDTLRNNTGQSYIDNLGCLLIFGANITKIDKVSGGLKEAVQSDSALILPVGQVCHFFVIIILRIRLGIVSVRHGRSCLCWGCWLLL